MRNLIDEKLLKFITVGLFNTLLGMIIMFGMYNLLGASYWMSSATNYILVSILSYVLNKTFTFGHKGKVIRSGISFAINIGICYLIAYNVAKPLMVAILADRSVSFQENMAMIFGMCIFTGLNYLGQRFFVFREESMKHIKTYDKWVSGPYLSEDEKSILRQMSEEEKYEAFYKYAEFGTAGMRGIMGLGTNRLNKYTIRMATKGLADMLGEGSSVAVAYDTRNGSAEFAEETAKVLAATGIKAYLFDRYSPVPLLSFAVRELGCDGGVVITASHNTKEYNGFKVYDRMGCQIGDEMADEIAANIVALEDNLDIATTDISHENIRYIGAEIINKYIDTVVADEKITDESTKVARETLNIVYTPLHGSGRDYVLTALDKGGFKNITLVKEQADYDGDFPTISKPNPEEKAAFAIAEKVAQEAKADIIIGTDPDCDRMGVGVATDGTVEYLTGNQTGVLLIDYLARTGKPKGKKLITSMVSSDMSRVVAESYGIDVIKTHTGFKNIGAIMNNLSEGEYFMGFEESYGYLPKAHVRDKDGVSAALTICQMVAFWKAQGKSLLDVMEELYEIHGYWIDCQQSFTFEGSAGVEKINSIMDSFRSKGAEAFAAIDSIEELLDYSKGLEGFKPANVLKFVFRQGSWIAIRPSGTEPKIKIYYCITAVDKIGAEANYERFKTVIETLIK